MKLLQEIGLKNTVGAIISFCFAIFLVLILAYLFDIDLSQIIEQLHQIDIAYLLIIILLTALNFFIAASKWFYIINKFNYKTLSFFICYLSVGLGAVIGIFLPSNIAVLFTRSIALKLTGENSLRESSYTVIYDIGLSIYSVLLFLPMSLAILYNVSPAMCSLIIVTTLLVGVAIPMIFQSKILAFFSFSTRRFPQLTKKLFPNNQDFDLFKLINRKTTSTILLFCIFQHLVLALRNYIVVLALGMKIGFNKIILVYPAIYIFSLVGITPGNLGITEWSWTGFLALSGVQAETATLYALFNRLLVIIGQISVTFITLFVFWFTFRKSFSNSISLLKRNK